MAHSSMQTVAKEVPVETGVDRKDRRELAKMLTKIVGSSHVLYAKVRGVHWNVVGPAFYSLHNMTEEHYEDLNTAIDDMAERIRAIGFTAPTGLSEMMENSSIKDQTKLLSTEDMVKELVEDHEKMARLLRDGVAAAEEVDDVKTADMLTERIGVHEEAAWMLRATIS
ncbi:MULTISPECIES: Dps family protein [Thalassospira]|jgi:starvation-inducible DNA-binding protein|uniref:Ferritin n=2 Tax=Thalassospira tepidiphila TaxID=393657 RepID=A0A853KWZ4_9PROT|nr:MULTISPECIES: DNA starvation/stationary phase protection protein [Thalassospira]EKF06991.1 ferritin DPS family DNA-binding protein [Thalassospira profundimaris WP0211]MBE70807.1 DNA starvation/stationary phase protection protein [Thalassospira sp.]MBO6580375.1 DNA starvation/stationary phase protection protein [Thalassospira sp.]MBO6803486.1 DNA starvation/stationary phase protection protein [Thalassospira sp.]MBO6818255.1 DNA starvation/stationary phase protection protein [Thalassospira sp